jgi:hypothetical protein
VTRSVVSTKEMPAALSIKAYDFGMATLPPVVWIVVNLAALIAP